MGRKGNKKRHKQTNPTHENDEQAIEGKCCHVKDGVKFSNLNNVIPHADLSCCQECDLSLGKDSNNTIEEDGMDKKSKTEGNSDTTLSTNNEEEKPGLCVCLRCGFIACSRYSTNQHALGHYNAKKSHPVVVNLSNWVVWCYECDNEVDNEEHISETKQCLSLLRKALGIKTSKHDKQQPPTKSIVGSNTATTTRCDSLVMKGLTNLGNTCFFNSVMQNLCQTRLLRLTMEHLMLGDFKYCIQPSKQDKNQEPLTILITAGGKLGPLTLALARFLQDMASDSKKRVVNPGNLFSEICKKAPRFKGFRQQDSQELLRYLLDSVRTEEIKVVKRGILHSFGVKTGVTKDDIGKKAADNKEHEKIRLYGRCAGAPVIDTLFGGQLVSLVECLTCCKVSRIMESFFDLSLSLAANKPSLHCNQNSKKRQEPRNDSKKNKNNERNVESSAQHTPSKHQQKKKQQQIKKEMKKRRHHNKSSSTSEMKLSEGDEGTALNRSDVENVTGDDIEVLENSVDNTRVNENGVTVPNSEGNSEENSCEEINSGILLEQDGSGERKENVGTTGSCGDIKDTSVNEGREDADAKSGCGVKESGEPKGMEELRDTRTEGDKTVFSNESVENEKVVEMNNVVESEDFEERKESGEPKGMEELRDTRTEGDKTAGFSNESVENEKVVEMNSVVESEDFEERKESTMSDDNTESVSSDNVELSKSCVEHDGGVCDEVDNMFLLKNYRKVGKQRDKGEVMDYEATSKEMHEDIRNVGDGTEKNENGSEEKKEDRNTRLCSTDTKDCKNEGETTDHESNIGIPNNDCTEKDMQHNETDSFNNNANKNSSVLSCNEFNPMVHNDVVSVHNGSSAIKHDNQSNVFQPTNDPIDTADEKEAMNNASSSNDIKAAVKTSPVIDSVDYPSNELNPKNNEVNTGFICSSDDLNAAAISDIDDHSTVKYNAIGNSNDNSDNISGAHSSNGIPSNELTCKTSDDSVDVIAPCLPLDPSLKDTTENHAVGLSNELDSLFNDNVSKGMNDKSNDLDAVIRDPSGKDNGDASTPVSAECAPSLQQDPLSYDGITVKECGDKNDVPNEGDGLVDGCSNECSVLQDANSQECVKDETVKSSNDGSEILPERHSLGDMRSFNANMSSIEGCLNKFCSPEILDGNNKFICEECNKRKTSEDENEETEDDKIVEEKKDTSKKSSKQQLVYTEAVKQLLIYQPPPILTLHLKRFHQVGFALKKLAKHIDFPLTLDLAPFCHSSSKVATDCEGKVLYSLSGVVEHSGSLHSGHYTAYCRVSQPSHFLQTKFESLTQLLDVMQQMWTQNDDHGCHLKHEESRKARWFYISDSHVSEVNEPRVLQAQAYLLFYERMVLLEDTESK